MDISTLKMDTPTLHHSTINFTNSNTSAEGEHLKGDILEGDIIGTHKSKGGKGGGGGGTGNGDGTEQNELNTLDEPIIDTIKRDLKAIGTKIWNAAVPNNNPKMLLVDWDMWGALFFATYIGIVLQSMNPDDQLAYAFTTIILFCFIGIGAVTYIQVWILRGGSSIFQLVSVLGYCLSPLAVYVTVCYIADFFIGRPFMMRFLLFLGAVAWSTYATSTILKPAEGPVTTTWHLGPICAHYLIIAALILYHTGGGSGTSIAPIVPAIPVSGSSSAAPTTIAAKLS